MFRTRDFVAFALATAFLVSGIGATIWTQSLRGNSQLAALPTFASGAEIEGAVSEESDSIPREENIARLKREIAAGKGDIAAGAPIFTSVDDTATSAPAVTDQTAPASVWIGHTLDGQQLFSDDVWRFAQFGPGDQIGAALNDVPIYGYRSDTAALDACGGVDEGFGYRFYLQPDKEIVPACFTDAPRR